MRQAHGEVDRALAWVGGSSTGPGYAVPLSAQAQVVLGSPSSLIGAAKERLPGTPAAVFPEAQSVFRFSTQVSWCLAAG